MGVIKCSAKSCGFSLSKKSRERLWIFLKWEDVFVCGFGRSAYYGILPKAFDLINGTASRSIVVVVSLSVGDFALFGYKTPLKTSQFLHFSKPYCILVQSLRHKNYTKP